MKKGKNYAIIQKVSLNEVSIIMEFGKTMCFSGHRPEKLPDYGDKRSTAVRALMSVINMEIMTSISEGYTRFFTGMSRGVDLWAGEMVAELKCRGEKIELYAALPYPGFTDKFTGDDHWTAGHILANANDVFTISPAYSKDCMRLRNQYMVDCSHKLLAVCRDSRSGTGQTIRMAERAGIAVKVIDLAPYFELSDSFSAK